jgi:hypothetical protein
MAGDLGFDPLGFSSWVNLGFVQEAEIKHGRLAMLGLAGCFVESAGLKFPGVDTVFGTSTVSEMSNLIIMLWSQEAEKRTSCCIFIVAERF